jgi:Do/DeqQ family serine protease
MSKRLLLSLVAATALARAEPSAVDLARQLESAFVSVAAEVSESVVVITATQKGAARREAPAEWEELPDDSPFRFFFRHHGFPLPERETDSQGSGTIFRKDGYILTNHHVVHGASAIKVRLKDGRELAAQLIGTDDRTDIAVLKVEATDLRAANFGNSDQVKVGQWAIAIGAPYQLEYSFTVGFVSAKERSAVWSRGGSAYEDYIQTDASINPGNSGGPLCDIEGRVIGINTLIRGINRGIGFAIPSNMARDVAEKLIRDGKIVRPWLGIRIESLADNKELTETLPDVKDGVVIRAIYPNTPAAQSDLKPADVITAVDGVPVRTTRDLQRQVLRKQIGDVVSLTVYRDGKPLKITLRTGELPEETQFASQRAPRDEPPPESVWGLTVQTLTKDLAEKLNLSGTTGVLVSDVAADSPAAANGLQRGDLITEVNRTPVATAEQFKAALARADPAKGALLYVQRDGASTFVVLKQNE